MNCPRCFGEIKPNQKFCPTCGFEIGTTEIEGVKTMAADEPEQAFSQPEGMQYQETQQPEGMQYQETQQPEGMQYQETQQPEGMQYGETQQPEGMQYQETQQPAAPQYQPAEQPAMPQYQQPVQSYQQPVQPASNPRDYSQQYQQYQQGNGIRGTRSGDGSLPPEKKKTTVIVLICVIAALVIGGAVVAAVLIFGGKGGDSDNNSSPASSQTSVIESTANTESTESLSTEPSSSSPQSSTEPTTTTVEPSTEPTESTTSPVPLGESNTVKNSKGIVLASDAAIDTTDSAAEAKLKSFLESQGVEDTTTSLTTMKFYAVGNVYVQEEQLLEKSTETERETYKSLMDQQFANADARISAMRSSSGVNNLVYVYALLDSDDEIIYQKFLK